MKPGKNEMAASANDAADSVGLGTFAGVFTPSILTILGIILFLRLGYVTGGGGVAWTLVILALANGVTILTSLSLAAVATNLKVKGGGDYYLISRTLGYKFGGSIGIVLYLAQSVSVAFYCIGFAEAVASMTGGAVQPQIIAALAVAGLFVFAWMGADWATKFQYLVMLLLVLALCSFTVGALEHWQESQFLANWSVPAEGQPFWLLFAIFFPAVTGFTQGVSMSGDLKDPGKSLPRGTFIAVGVSILVYFGVIVLFAGSLPGETLRNDYQAMQQVSKYGFLVDAGVVAATLSSAMASFMGGPRILQSLAADRIFPLLDFLAKGSGEANNPRRCVILTLAIALLVIALGQLNLVARIVSMFFLISYGLLNYATYYEADTGSASFRPRFRFFNKYLSLAGCLLCLAILLALDTNSGVAALAVIFAIYLYLKHRNTPSRWADSSRSHAFSRVRKNLEQMAQVPHHMNDWYPHLLAFTNSRDSRRKLLRFGDWLCGDTGIIHAIQILDGHGLPALRRRAAAEKELEEDIAESGVASYPKVVVGDDFSATLSIVLQAQGVGPLQGNTLLTNWYNEPASHLPGLELLKYGHNLRTAYHHGFNLVIFHCEPSKWESLVSENGRRERIDVWWREDDDSSRLMLLFAYLMTRDKLWKNAEIRVVATGEKVHFREARESLIDFFEEARIPAEPVSAENMKPETVIEHSKGSSFVFLPFRIRKSRLTDVEGYSLERVLSQLPPAAMVMAAEEIDLDSEPEEGAAAELARAMDELYDVEKRLRRAERDEAEAVEKVEQLAAELESRAENDGQEEDNASRSELKKTLARAEELQEQMFRKKAKAKGRFEHCIERVKALGGSLDERQG